MGKKQPDRRVISQSEATESANRVAEHLRRREGATGEATPLAIAVELWALHRYFCERHDRAVCTGEKLGIPFAETIEQRIACAKHNVKVGRLTRRLMHRMGIFRDDARIARMYVWGLEQHELAALVLHSKWIDEYERETD